VAPRLNFEDRYQRFYASVLDRLLGVAYRKALPAVEAVSSVLAEGLDKQRVAQTARLHIPHYWADYLHEDRRSFGPAQKKWLVYFPNPEDDPRLSPTYPVRLSDVRGLDEVWGAGAEGEFRAAKAENRRREKLGMPPFMVFAKRRGFRPGSFFFRDLDIEQEAAPIIASEFDKFIVGIAKSLSETKVAKVPLKAKKR